MFVRQHKSKEFPRREAKGLKMFQMRVWEFTDCAHQSIMLYIDVVNSRELPAV